jgi:hypothetical protein
VALLGLAVGAGASAAPARAAESPPPDPAAAPPAEANAPAPAKPAAKGVPSTWHATAFVSGIGTYRIIHHWSQGASMRAETLIAGHPITTIVHGDRYAVIDRLTGRGLEVARAPRSLAQDAGRLRPFAFEPDEIRAAGGELVETTKVSGVDVEIWRVSEDSGRRTAWVSRAEPKVPLRVETFVRGSSQTIRIDYSNWAFDLEIPAAFFAIPPGIEVDRMSYEDYGRRSQAGELGRLPVLYPDLLHGTGD